MDGCGMIAINGYVTKKAAIINFATYTSYYLPSFSYLLPVMVRETYAHCFCTYLVLTFFESHFQ